MPSKNERERWNRWYEDTTARMKRQRRSLDRVVLLLTESVAALEEIAGMDPQGDEWDDAAAFKAAQERAQDALDRVKETAAAERQDIEGIEAETPVSDPHNRG